MSASHDPVQEYLVERGCAEHVVTGGLAGLLDAWETFAKALGKGYAQSLDDYLNDLDARQILADAWVKASPAQRSALQSRLQAADRRVRTATSTSEVCLWGSKIARRERYTAEANWWYYAVPKKPAPALRAELEKVR